jgi:4-amino-4-deoxy-L-arabinose transferase-like glycosyltransferase
MGFCWGENKVADHEAVVEGTERQVKGFDSDFWGRDLLLLTLFIGLLFGILLGARFLQTPDEGRYVEISREMLVLHDYVTPHINFIKYFEKPPFFYWIEALQIKLFGLNFWSVRFPTAFMGVLGCLFTYIAGRKLYGRGCGILAACVLASSLLYFIMAHAITLDMTLSVCLAASLFSFIIAVHEKGRAKDLFLWAMYGFSALAVLTKGFIGVIFPGLIIFAWTLLFNQWKELLSWRLFSGLALFLVISLPWHILVQLRHPEFFDFYAMDQQILRYFTSIADREQPLWFLPTVLALGFLPWIFFLCQSFYSVFPAFKDRTSIDARAGGFLILWALIIYFFFQASHSQLMPYILPIFPAISLLVARYFCRLSDQKQSIGIRIGLVGLLAFSFCLLFSIGLILGGAFGPYQTIILGLKGHYLLVSGGIFFAMTCFAMVAYWRKSIPHVALVLILGMGCFSISFLGNREVFEQNSSYRLAQLIRENGSPTTPIFVYQGYFQDLPVYTQRRIIQADTLNDSSELFFGVRHQAMGDWLITPDEFWEKVSHPREAFFVVMSHDNYNQLSLEHRAQLNLKLKTNREVLLEVVPNA